MKILVCIKQVPGTTQVNVDPETGVLIRDGVESKMNPYDLFALQFQDIVCMKGRGRIFLYGSGCGMLVDRS